MCALLTAVLIMHPGREGAFWARSQLSDPGWHKPLPCWGNTSHLPALGISTLRPVLCRRRSDPSCFTSSWGIFLHRSWISGFIVCAAIALVIICLGSVNCYRKTRTSVTGLWSVDGKSKSIKPSAYMIYFLLTSVLSLRIFRSFWSRKVENQC